MDIQKTLLEKIENNQVTPIPTWRFLIRGYGLWVLSGFLLIFGSFSVASVLYILTKNDWDIYLELHESKLMHILITLPYLWLALFLITLGLLYLDIKHTKHGYRYNALTLILGTVGLSVVCGGLLHLTGFGQRVDALLRDTVPAQAHLFNPRLRGLSQPGHGVLTGRIATIEQTSSTTLRVRLDNPLLKETWFIIVQESTVLPPKGIRVRDHIRVLGEEVEQRDTAEHTFVAHMILPFNTLDKTMRGQRRMPPPSPNRQ
jgi:hypothetical protein